MQPELLDKLLDEIEVSLFNFYQILKRPVSSSSWVASSASAKQMYRMQLVLFMYQESKQTDLSFQPRRASAVGS